MSGSDERKFLHDIATPLGTAMFLMDVIIEGLRQRAEANAEEIEQAEQVRGALEKVKEMLAKRRDVLVARGGQGAGS